MDVTTTPEPQTWLIVSGIGNFRATRDRGFTVQGMKSRHRRKADRMAPGDRLVWYITGIKAIAGVATITGPYFESHDRIWASADPKKDAEDYPFRVTIAPDVVLDEADYVPAEPLAQAMDYTKRWPAKNWTLAFQGNVHLLPEHDNRLIREAVEAAALRAADHRTGSLVAAAG